MYRAIASLVLAAVTVLGGCEVNGPKNNDPRYGDGSLPVEERQSLEEFVGTVESRAVVFMQAVDSEGADLWLPENNESSLESCGYPVYGYQLRGPTVFGHAIPEENIVRLAERHVKPLGFDYMYRKEDEVNIDYRWFNLRDGGYVNVILYPDGRLLAQYVSGCRPYHGEGKPEHIRTAWEEELIARQPPKPDPSKSPSPSETPLN